MRVFLDSVIIIYYLDHTGKFQARAANRLAACHAAGDEVAVSDLVRMECRVDPIRKGDNVRLTRFDGFFTRPDVHIVPITTVVFDRATQIRATHGYRTIDSINLAAAAEADCNLFLTNDTQLSGFPDIAVEILH
jgi:predicted nucleic acid-binding protein